MSTIIKVRGFFISYDKYDRVKLMFLDDYEYDTPRAKMSFVKKYVLVKSKKIKGNNPLAENNTCFMIKCPKNTHGYRKDEFNKDVIVPLKDLQQHKVECIVSVNEYKFTKNDETIEGWNLKLIKMSLFEV